MGPGADHEHICDARLLALGPEIGFQRSEEIFGIKPSADGHDRATNILKVRSNVASLPESIVSRMSKELGPFGRATLQQKLVRVRQRPHPEEKIISIGRFVIEWFGFLVQWVLSSLGEGIKEAEILRQKESAIVVQVVANEPGHHPRRAN